LQHLDLAQLRDDLLGLRTFASHSLILLNSGSHEPSKRTTSMGALHDAAPFFNELVRTHKALLFPAGQFLGVARREYDSAAYRN
ncbi:MAG: hypothetical protein ACFB03_07100, partial [Paracoccaceae bacterium]